MSFDPTPNTDIHRPLLWAAAVTGGLGMLVYGIVMAELMYPGLNLFDSGRYFNEVLIAKTALISLAAACIVTLTICAILQRSSALVLGIVGLVGIGGGVVTTASVHAWVWLEQPGFFGKWLPELGVAAQGWVWPAVTGLFIAAALVILLLRRGAPRGRTHLICGLIGLFLSLGLFVKIYLAPVDMQRVFHDSFVDVALEFAVSAEALLTLFLWAALSVKSPTARGGWLSAISLQVVILTHVGFLYSLGRMGMPRNYIDYPDFFASRALGMSVSYFVMCVLIVAVALHAARGATKPEQIFE